MALLLVIVGLTALYYLWRRHNAPMMFGIVREKAGFYLFTGVWAAGFGFMTHRSLAVLRGGALILGGAGLWRHAAWGWSASVAAVMSCFAYAVVAITIEGLSLLNLIVFACILFETWELVNLRRTYAMMRTIDALGPYQADD